MRFFLFLLLPSFAWGWGATGHRTVGEVAEIHLSKKGKKFVRSIMGEETLAEASTWADWIRAEPSRRSLSPWHYTNLKDGEKYKEPKHKMDVVKAIKKLKKVLNGEEKDSGLSKKEALRLLTHFIGDLHQPLHAGREGDRGGNRIKVLWFGKEEKLHAVWDTEIIEHSKLSYTELTAFINKKANIKKEWYGKSAADWANESAALRPLVYDFRSQYVKNILPLQSQEELEKAYPGLKKGSTGAIPKLKWDYNYRAWPVVQQRLLQGGLRLAETINELSN